MKLCVYCDCQNPTLYSGVLVATSAKECNNKTQTALMLFTIVTVLFIFWLS